VPLPVPNLLEEQEASSVVAKVDPFAGPQEAVAEPVFAALQLVPVQVHVQGPVPETPPGEPARQSSVGVEGADETVVPLAEPHPPGDSVAPHEISPLPQVQSQPTQYPFCMRAPKL